MITNAILVEKINKSIDILNKVFSDILGEKIEFNAVIDNEKVYIGVKTKFNKDLTNKIFKINPGYTNTKLNLILDDYSLNNINNTKLKEYKRCLYIYPNISLYKEEYNDDFFSFFKVIKFKPFQNNNPWTFVKF